MAKLLYNVTVVIDHTIEKEWVAWMTDTHIPDVMSTGKFLSYSMQKILDSENETGVTYAIQYLCPDKQTFDKYQQENAPQLQKHHSTRYDGRYASFRTLMEVISHS